MTTDIEEIQVGIGGTMKKKANGEGSIYFDENRQKFKAMIVDPTGKRITKRFSTKAEAVEWLTLKKSDIFRKEYVVDNTVLLGEWLIEYLNTYKKAVVKNSTYERYLTTMKNIQPIASIPLQDLSPIIIQKFYNTLPPLSSSSKLKIHKLLNAALTKASQLGLMKDIMSAVEPMCKESQQEVEIFTTDEVETILSTLKTSHYYSRYYILVKLAISTGARLGELLALKPENVYHDYIKIIASARSDANGKTVISTPKTVAGNRAITISPTLANGLRKVAGNAPYVFHTAHNTPWGTRNVERAWKAILKESGIPHKKFHSLRHTHATQLLANGIPLLEVAKRLGHAKVSHTLNLYGHAIPGYDKKIPSVINDIFKLDPI